MLWGYLMYFQYMLIWAGNLPDEITWYVRRAEGGWEPLAWTLAGLGFLVPFWLLLFRRLKRNPRWLGSIAGLLIVMQLVAVYWLVEPAFAPDGPAVDLLLPLIDGGLRRLVAERFLWRLRAAPAPGAERSSPARGAGGKRVRRLESLLAFVVVVGALLSRRPARACRRGVDAEDLEEGYEHSDASIGWIVAGGIALLVALGGVVLVATSFEAYVTGRLRDVGPPPDLVNRLTPAPTPPPPRLEVAEGEDLAAYRAVDEQS